MDVYDQFVTIMKRYEVNAAWPVFEENTSVHHFLKTSWQVVFELLQAHGVHLRGKLKASNPLPIMLDFDL